jgi:hypothetical protein
MYTVVAFILGVLLCQMVKAQVSNLRGKLGG